MWLVRATASIDIGWRDLIQWAMVIAQGTYGAVTLRDLMDMTAADILALVEEFNRMVREQKESAKRAREE